MSCEGCAVKFTVFKRRRQCCICQRHYCTHCLQGVGSQSATSVLARLSEKQLKCAKCTVLTARPLSRSQLRQLRAKDLQLYLTSQKVSTHGCVATENSTTNATSQTHSTSEAQAPHEMPEKRSSPETVCHVSTSSSSSSLHSTPRSVGVDIVEVIDSNSEQSTSDSGPEPVIFIADEESSQADEAQPVEAEEMVIEVEACTGISLGSIQSVEDLEKLTVKQLKELLSLNRVDYRGCCEKPELVERVTRLWQDDIQAKKGKVSLIIPS
ncbi:E3 ubiquitin-protein ligase rififylin [Blattella germanica]|nr:E3 ubiquitin-protein ligase rififylin [Blattella germanica]